jgi:hypothetical protein
MKISYLAILLVMLILGCNKEKEISSFNPENWYNRATNLNAKDPLEYGKSYLSIYSQLYSMPEHKTHNLTAMASLRNTSETDSIYILKAFYYDTHGKLIRKYFDF